MKTKFLSTVLLLACADDHPQDVIGHSAQALTGYYVIWNQNSALCVGVDHGSTSSGAYVKQFDCDFGPNQHWRDINESGGGARQIQDKKSGLCITVDGTPQAGSPLVQRPCSSARTWIYSPSISYANRVEIYEQDTGLCIGVDHASRSNGASMMTFPCDDRANQQWSIDPWD